MAQLINIGLDLHRLPANSQSKLREGGADLASTR